MAMGIEEVGMKTPRKDVQQILDWASKASTGHFPMLVVAHYAVECIVNNDDPSLLSELPQDVTASIREMIDVYKSEGKVLVLSNVGEADHTDIVRQLVRVLEGSERAS
jgi:hypothetical protein